jgi:hypothetical protein
VAGMGENSLDISPDWRGTAGATSVRRESKLWLQLGATGVESAGGKPRHSW